MTYCHKHGRHNCQACIDELVSLGIQADKDRIAELEAKAAELEDAKSLLRDAAWLLWYVKPVVVDPISQSDAESCERLYERIKLYLGEEI